MFFVAGVYSQKNFDVLNYQDYIKYDIIDKSMDRCVKAGKRIVELNIDPRRDLVNEERLRKIKRKILTDVDLSCHLEFAQLYLDESKKD
jgi:hypothetical protein